VCVSQTEREREREREQRSPTLVKLNLAEPLPNSNTEVSFVVAKSSSSLADVRFAAAAAVQEEGLQVERREEAESRGNACPMLLHSSAPKL